MIHAEVVLQGNRSECLCRSFDLDMLLGFDSLMQTVTPATTFHDTSRLFVYNFNLAVDNNILIVAVEHGISFEQLQDGVDTLAFHCIFLQECILFF